MSGERREPTFSGGASTPEETTAATATEARQTQKRRPPPVSKSALPVHVVSKSPLAPLALLVALAGVGLGVFSYFELLQARQEISSSEVRIIELEGKLALSGDESSQSMAALQANLRTMQKDFVMANTEVRKLWDTRNVNRKAIIDNSSKLKNTASQAKSANTLAKSHAKILTTISSESALQTEQLSLVSGQADEQQKRLREVQDLANKLDSQMAKLSGDLAARVKNNEEAVAAIDAYRRSTNRQLLELKQKISAPAAP